MLFGVFWPPKRWDGWARGIRKYGNVDKEVNRRGNLKDLVDCGGKPGDGWNGSPLSRDWKILSFLFPVLKAAL